MKRGKNELSYNSGKDIPLILESYNDIFSSFDPRSYSQRALSKDFIIECEKASEDKKEEIRLKFLIKKDKRNLREEELIIKRIKDHFEKHFLEKKKELFYFKLTGFIWFLVGCFLTAITAFFMEKEISYIMKVLVNLAHPAGWFFLWEGMGKIIIHSKEKKAEYIFNKKMYKSKISFLSIK
jgi:hypothetical protein